MKNESALQNLADFNNKSLLIVDDDNPFRERLARAMEKKGFEVIQAEGVQKGIDTVKAKKPGFAVVDLRLGDGNGLEVVKQIQTSNPFPSLSLKSPTAKAGFFDLTASIPFFTPSACITSNPFFSIALASLSLNGLSSSTINKDLLSKSLRFCNCASFFIALIWSFFSTIQ